VVTVTRSYRLTRDTLDLFGQFADDPQGRDPIAARLTSEENARRWSVSLEAL
jgi:hypothetical protein